MGGDSLRPSRSRHSPNVRFCASTSHRWPSVCHKQSRQTSVSKYKFKFIALARGHQNRHSHRERGGQTQSASREPHTSPSRAICESDGESSSAPVNRRRRGIICRGPRHRRRLRCRHPYLCLCGPSPLICCCLCSCRCCCSSPEHWWLSGDVGCAQMFVPISDTMRPRHSSSS